MTWTSLFLIFFLVNAIVWYAFQKRYFPKWATKIISRIYFWPTFPVTALLRTGNYWTPIDDTIILGCAPMSFLGHPESLYSFEVRGTINMCCEYDGPVSAYKDLGITQLHLPSVDHFEPSFEYMQDAVKFIEDFSKRKERVYIHCKAGHGRAASIALCWLIYSNRGKTPQELNQYLFSKRKVRDTLYKQPNVQAFYNYVQTLKK